MPVPGYWFMLSHIIIQSTQVPCMFITNYLFGKVHSSVLITLLYLLYLLFVVYNDDDTVARFA